mgnify:FL=1
MNFIKNIIYLLKFYFSKKSRPFILPIILGILSKLNSIALFIIPIQAIKSVSEGTLSYNLKEVMKSIRLPIPSEEYTFIFFFILILVSLLTLIIINKLININIKNIKLELTLESGNFNFQLTKSNYYKFNKILNNIDNIIDNSQNFLFCLLLILFIIFYDLQIALILLFGGLSYLYLLKLSNKYFFKNNFNQLIIKEDKNKSFYYKIDNKIKVNSYNDLLYMPFISTITMLLIMTAVYLRVNSGISIIFIFLIRIFQSNMLNSLKSFVLNHKKLFKF